MTTQSLHGRLPHWRTVWAVAVTGFCAALPALADSVDKRAAADPHGQVEVSNTSGSISISGWDRSEVEVTGELGDGSQRLEFVTSGKLTRIKVIVPKSGPEDDSDLEIRVPARSSIAVNTVSADIDVTGVAGSQRLQSVSADVTTQAGAEDVEAKTVSGDITVVGKGQHGLLTITTVSGDARIEKVAGEVNANTVSGDLNVSLGDTTRLRLRSTSGDLGMNGRLVDAARVDVESISGDVRIGLAGKVNAEFDIASFNGEIRNCFGPKSSRTSEYAPGRELRFREGTGSARVRIKTLNGDVNVCNQ